MGGTNDPTSADTQPLRLTAVDTSSATSTRLVAIVPPALAMLPLDAADFTVHQGDATIRPQVTRLASRGLQVVLVPDRTVKPADISLELAASIELVHLLPDTVTVLTLGDPSGDLLTADRAATMRTLAKLTGAQQPSTFSAIATSIFVPPVSLRRVYVLLTTCRSKPTAVDQDQLQASLGQHPQQSQQIDMIQIGRACSAPIPKIVRAGGGTVVNAPNANELAMAADRVNRGLLAQYQLTFPTNPAHGSTTVEVSAMHVRAQATIRASTPAVQNRASQHGNLRLLLIVLALIIVIVAGVFTIELAHSRHPD